MRPLYLTSPIEAVCKTITSRIKSNLNFPVLSGKFLKVLILAFVLQSFTPSFSFSQTGLQFNGTSQYVTFGKATIHLDLTNFHAGGLDKYQSCSWNITATNKRARGELWNTSSISNHYKRKRGR